MPRIHRPDNYGVSQIIHSSQRPYGKCEQCKQIKPITWISHDRCLCRVCMKSTSANPSSNTNPVSQSDNFPFKISQAQRQYAPFLPIRKASPNLHPTAEKPQPISKAELSSEEKAYRREINRKRKIARKRRIAKERGQK